MQNFNQERVLSSIASRNNLLNPLIRLNINSYTKDASHEIKIIIKKKNLI